MSNRFTARLNGGKAEEPIVIMARRSERSDAGAYGLRVQIQCEELAISLGPSSLVDAVSRALLAHHAESISEGRRPAGGAQVPLDPHGTQGALAARGKRPKARGNTGKPNALPPNLTRLEIRASGQLVTIAAVRFGIGPKTAARIGTKASAKIEPATALQAKYVDEEEAAGIELLSVDGAADRVIERAVIDYLAKIYDGTRYYSPEKIRASEL